MTVVDFKSAAFWKQLERQYDLRRVEVDYGDITRAPSAANTSASDPIVLGEAAAAQVAALFPRYGFPAVPETWAEFRANHTYIESIENGVDTFRVAFRHKPDQGIAFVRQRYEGLADAIILAIQGDYDALAAFNVANNVYRKNAEGYDESLELPDGPE